jgi:hypothetical protein
MSNTLIQIKRSLSTAVPPNGSLVIGEQAYSYSSNTLFIGAPDGTGVIAVGGKYYIDTTIAAFAHANAAFLAANNGLGLGAAFAAANAAFAAANGAFASANAGQATANASYDFANSAHSVANLAFDHANAAFAAANAGLATANAGIAHANAAFATANAAYDEANTKFSSSGGTISGDVLITGNLSVTGNATVFTANNLVINDPFILLANNNTSDVLDIGFTGHYDTDLHTGLFRSAGTKEWYLFKGYNEHFFYDGGSVDINANNFTLDILNADFKTSNLILGGTNAISWLQSIFAHANTAHESANAALATGNAALASANAGLASANAAHAIANIAFNQANTAYAQANAASAQAANADFLTSGTIATGRISGPYTGITAVGTITSGEWNGSAIDVTHGGTGSSSFTTNGILFGNGTSPLNVTAAGTEGQVLQASSAGVPQFAMLDGGTF